MGGLESIVQQLSCLWTRLRTCMQRLEQAIGDSPCTLKMADIGKATSSAKTSALRGVDIREKLSLWDSSLAPLSSSQKEGVMSLSAVANNRPFPKNVSFNIGFNYNFVDRSRIDAINLSVEPYNRNIFSSLRWHFVEKGLAIVCDCLIPVLGNGMFWKPCKVYSLHWLNGPKFIQFIIYNNSNVMVFGNDIVQSWTTEQSKSLICVILTFSL